MNKLFFATIGVAMVSAQAGAQTPAPAPGGAMPQQFTRQQAQQSADAMFQQMDANHDGTLTRDEAEQGRAQMGGRGEHMIERAFGTATSLTLAQFEASSLARFDAMDTNHDGVVTAAERDQARALRAQQRQGQ